MNVLKKIFQDPYQEKREPKEGGVSRRKFLKSFLLIGGTVTLFGDKVFALTENIESDPALEPFENFLKRRRDELYKEGKKALEVNTIISNEAFEMYSKYTNTENTEGKKLLTTEYQLILLNYKKLLGLNNTLKQLYEDMNGKETTDEAIRDYDEKRSKYTELYTKVSKGLTAFKDKSNIQQGLLSKCLRNLKELDKFENSVALNPNHKEVSTQLHREGRETIMLYIAHCFRINELNKILATINPSFSPIKKR